MNTRPKIYCDTSTLAPNIRDPKSLPELEALKRLRELCQAGKCPMLRSHIALRELEETKDVEQRERLKADYDLLERVLKDERLLGFSHNVDQFGGFVTCPLIQDIQDPKIFDEIYRQLKYRVSGEPDLNTRRDAEHLTQAICNDCDVFLTRDCKTIIKPLGQWLEQWNPPLKIRLPSQILADIEHS